MRIAYFIVTGLLTALMSMSVGLYIFNHAEAVKSFSGLGYPVYLIYPLAIAKALGLIAIWTNLSKSLKEWAYAGFFFNTLLAASAHLATNDGKAILAIIAVILVLASYNLAKRLGRI